MALIIGFQEPKSTPQQLEASLLATLDKYFWDEGHQRWRETAGKDDQVFLWGYSVLLSTFAIGAKVAPGTYKLRMEKTFAGLERYWTDKAPGAYAVSPGQNRTNPDRYYDDNAWVGLAALEAYDATHDSKYIELAVRVLRYLRSGEDDKLGGGIYWHENKKESKNACVNAPAALLAYRLYMATRKQDYVADGDRWLKWLDCLFDEKDNLVMDNINLSGTIDRTKWSYNSGVYMEALQFHNYEAMLSHPKETDLSGYYRLLAMTRASYDKWIDVPKKLAKDPGMFAMHLEEAFLGQQPDTVVPASGMVRHRRGSNELVQSVFEKCRNEEGLLGEYWNRKPLPKEDLKLMFTASLLRTSLISRRH